MVPICGFKAESTDFLLILQLEEPAILFHHSCRCYGTPAEVCIIQQGDHLSMWVISESKLLDIFWVLEDFSTHFGAA